MDLPAEFGIFPNRGGRGGLVDLESKVSAAEKKFQTIKGGRGPVPVWNSNILGFPKFAGEGGR